MASIIKVNTIKDTSDNTLLTTSSGNVSISNDLIVDTDTLYVDSTNNRVGIGTTSPSTAFVATTNANGRVIMLTHDTGLNEIRSADSDQTTYVNLRYDATEHIFENSNTEAMRIDSSGNVLIGATGATSSSKFRVRGTNTTNATYCFRFENGNGVVFQAEDSGRFYTGTQSQSPYNYAVTGRDVYVSSAGLLGYLSSIRDSKTNIENISDVSWLYQLNPVSFNYKVQDEQGNYTEEAEADKFYGLIAEEVETVNPDICFYKNNNPENGLAGVDYKKLYAPIIKALQELKTENEELKARITALET